MQPPKRIRHPEIDSTNLEAKRQAEAGAAASTIVTADIQTHGRGRNGRNWQSLPGNVHWSIILRPEDSWPPFVQVGFVGALAVIDTLISLGELDRWIAQGFDPIRSALTERLHGLDQVAIVDVGADRPIKGRVLGIDETGLLLIDQPGNHPHRLAAGDLVSLSDEPA